MLGRDSLEGLATVTLPLGFKYPLVANTIPVLPFFFFKFLYFHYIRAKLCASMYAVKHH